MIWQYFRLDPPRALSYLALIAAAACAHTEARLLPEPAQPVSREQVVQWADSTLPRNRILHRFKWSFHDDQGGSGGRGSARIAGPDSLRFDVAGPLGAGKTSAVVIGDSARWVDPEKSLHDLVPNYPLLWAMFGVAREPEPDAQLRGFEDGTRRAWEGSAAGDTVTYVRILGKNPQFQAEVREGGKVLGRVETTFAEDGTLVKSRLTVPSRGARLDVNFYSSTAADSFPSGIWLRREP